MHYCLALTKEWPPTKKNKLNTKHLSFVLRFISLAALLDADSDIQLVCKHVRFERAISWFAQMFTSQHYTFHLYSLSKQKSKGYLFLHISALYVILLKEVLTALQSLHVLKPLLVVWLMIFSTGCVTGCVFVALWSLDVNSKNRFSVT